MMYLILEVVERGRLHAVSIESPLHERIAIAQLSDEEVQKIKQKLEERDSKYECFRSYLVWTRELFGLDKD
jgi:hypothetical protein